jgi:hypothetical protein
MIIETEHKLFDPLWILHDNEIKRLPVHGILVTCYSNSVVKLKYAFPIGPDTYAEIPEDKCFRSKQDLLASL